MYNFQTDVKINPHRLHLEWVKQPELYAKWGELHVEAIYNRDKLQIELDVCKAKLDSKIRAHWESFGLTKPPTEAGVVSFINSSKEYIQLMSAIHEKTYQINMFNAARQALEHKKRALEGLERLHLAGYYATNTCSPDGGAEQADYNAAIQKAALANSQRTALNPRKPG